MGYTRANIIQVEEVKKIEIGDSEILAIGLPKEYDYAQVKMVQEQLAKMMPEKMHKILLYVGGIKFSSIKFVDGKLENKQNSNE